MDGFSAVVQVSLCFFFLGHRIVTTKHEHDGNELQVTEGFRIHVARKLEHLLDG